MAKRRTLTTAEAVGIMEDRFKVATSLVGDLSRYPILREDQLDFETDRERSRTFAEVFTPVYMVDEMLGVVPDLSSRDKVMDLCAGHGQYTIRMLRRFLKTDRQFDLRRYLMERHFFNEIQLGSAWRLIWIFGSNINLAIGSALALERLPAGWRGIWLYVESVSTWVPITELVRAIRPSFGTGKLYQYSRSHEDRFVSQVESLLRRFGSTVEDTEMSIKQIMGTPEGRRRFLEEISECASGVEENWQDKATPAWVCREMVNSIPGGIDGLRKILVLFNAEFLEVLVKEKKIDPRRIDFGYDSEAEGLFASSIYKTHTFSVGKTFSDLCGALEGKSGQYDVVFSNPPYQIADGGYKASARPIYHEIVCHAIDQLAPRYVCMITPSRWMIGGKGLNDYRARMLADRRVRMIQDFPGTNDVFSTVSIAGGVSYFLWDRDYDGPCEFNGIPRYLDEFDIVVRDNMSISILKKVLKKHEGKPFCNSRVLPQKPFGLRTFFKDWVDEGTEGSVKCYAMKREQKWVSPDAFTDTHSVLKKHKICIARARSQGITDTEGRGDPSTVTAYTFHVKPNEICLETYLVAGAFGTKKEANNYDSYLRTKFYRFCLMQRLVSQDINKQKFSWVPDFQDYTVEYTDQDLYKHFGFTKREIDHIEKTIKSMD